MTAPAERRHGYGAYSHGCRCPTCRTAKADYIRTRRATARALAQRVAPRPPGNRDPRLGWHIVPGITHGRTGYEERGCRCETCRDAHNKSNSNRPYRRKIT